MERIKGKLETHNGLIYTTTGDVVARHVKPEHAEYLVSVDPASDLLKEVYNIGVVGGDLGSRIGEHLRAYFPEEYCSAEVSHAG